MNNISDRWKYGKINVLVEQVGGGKQHGNLGLISSHNATENAPAILLYPSGSQSFHYGDPLDLILLILNAHRFSSTRNIRKT